MLPFTTLDIRWGKKITPHNAKNRHQSSFNRETRTVQWWIALKSQSMYWNTYPWCKWCTQTVRWRQKKQQSVLDYESSDNSNYWLLKKKKTHKKTICHVPASFAFFLSLSLEKRRRKSWIWSSQIREVITYLQSITLSLQGLGSHPTVGSCGRRNYKSHLVRTQSLNILLLKPGVGQYIAIHATLTARDFFLAYFYPSVHSTAFFQNLSQFFPVLAVANTRSCVGPQNKKRSPCLMQVPVLSTRGI